MDAYPLLLAYVSYTLVCALDPKLLSSLILPQGIV